ncbi:MAG: hypothetical protein DWH96_01055 [Planctomycetota bacterium]|nr:MAG: hypothetical protein DWH96_01055 [Planctomycetota bacterium]RLS94881.1 MAG: hypothetical protein DWI11_03915 [Planctomycetota bacterium]
MNAYTHLVFAAPTLLLLVPPATDALAPVAKAAPLGLLGLIVVYAVTLFGMAAIGWVAWKRVSKQEANDPVYQAKLDADDERVKTGRFANDFRQPPQS